MPAILSVLITLIGEIVKDYFVVSVISGTIKFVLIAVAVFLFGYLIYKNW